MLSLWKNAPCCDALIKAGISKVVVAAQDPDLRVNGRGIKRLRAAGLCVVENVCKEEALDIMKDSSMFVSFLDHMSH